MEEYLEFNVGREDWNKYQLSDGTILKAKLVVIHITRTKLNIPKKATLGINSQFVLGIQVPDNFIKTPSEKQYTIDQLRKYIVDDDIDYEIIKENWNIYKLKDGTRVKIKPVITNISRTNKYNDMGQPIYVVDNQVNFHIKGPSKKKKKGGKR